MRKAIIGLGLLGLMRCSEADPLVIRDSRLNELLPSAEYLSVENTFYVLEEKLKEGNFYGQYSSFGDFHVKMISGPGKTVYFRFSHKEDYKSVDGREHSGSWFFDDNYEGPFFQVDSGPQQLLNEKEELDGPREGHICYKNSNSVGFRPVIENPEMAILTHGLILASPDLLHRNNVEPNHEFRQAYESLKVNKNKYIEEYRDRR